jgi:hypothetical protein
MCEMKLTAITTFPPSQGPLSSFGYHAIMRFLESDEIEQLVILGDSIDAAELAHQDPRLTIERCWGDNSWNSTAKILARIIKHKPDVVWINLQYTLFGTAHIPAFLGLLLPGYLRSQGYRTITTLHNFPAMIDLNDVGIPLSHITRCLLGCADFIAMKSIMSSDIQYLRQSGRIQGGSLAMNAA